MLQSLPPTPPPLIQSPRHTYATTPTPPHTTILHKQPTCTYTDPDSPQIDIIGLMCVRYNIKSGVCKAQPQPKGPHELLPGVGEKKKKKAGRQLEEEEHSTRRQFEEGVRMSAYSMVSQRNTIATSIPRHRRLNQWDFSSCYGAPCVGPAREKEPDEPDKGCMTGTTNIVTYYYPVNPAFMYGFIIPFAFILVTGRIGLAVVFEVDLKYSICLLKREFGFALVPTLNVIFEAYIRGESFYIKSGAGVDLTLIGIGLEPWMTMYMKDGFSIGIAMYLNIEALTICINAFIEVLWFKFCFYIIPCGFQWKTLKEWSMACKTAVAKQYKIFEVGGGEDRTPPALAELTLQQTTATRIEMKFEGFIDEETDVISITLALRNGNSPVGESSSACAQKAGDYLFVVLAGAPEEFEANLEDYVVFPQKLPGNGEPIQFCAMACNSDNACVTGWSPELTWDTDPPRLVQLWMWDPFGGIYTQPYCPGRPRNLWTEENVLHSSCETMYTNSSSTLTFQLKAADYPADAGSNMSGIKWAILRRKVGETEEPSDAEQWLDLGSPHEIEVLAPGSDMMTVGSRELELEHGKTHYISLYMVDSKGNHKVWLSYPLMVDLTPPPIGSLRFPRIYPGELPRTPRPAFSHLSWDALPHRFHQCTITPSHLSPHLPPCARAPSLHLSDRCATCPPLPPSLPPPSPPVRPVPQHVRQPHRLLLCERAPRTGFVEYCL